MVIAVEFLFVVTVVLWFVICTDWQLETSGQDSGLSYKVTIQIPSS